MQRPFLSDGRKEGVIPRKTTACLALLLFLHGVTACTAGRVHGPREGLEQSPPGIVEAKTFPEISIEMRGGESHLGKITGLENQRVRFLPFPYWNVETLRIEIADITSIVLSKKGGKAGRAAAYGFGCGFLATGLVLAATSKYNSDYQTSLIASAASGGCTALVLMAISAINGAGEKNRYDLSPMTLQQKTGVIIRLMTRHP